MNIARLLFLTLVLIIPASAILAADKVPFFSLHAFEDSSEYKGETSPYYSDWLQVAQCAGCDPDFNRADREKVKNAGSGRNGRIVPSEGTKEAVRNAKDDSTKLSLADSNNLDRAAMHNGTSIQAEINRIREEEATLYNELKAYAEGKKEKLTKKGFRRAIDWLCKTKLCGPLVDLFWPAATGDATIMNDEDLEKWLEKIPDNLEPEKAKKLLQIFKLAFEVPFNLEDVPDDATFRWLRLISDDVGQPHWINSGCKQQWVRQPRQCNFANLYNVVASAWYHGVVQAVGWGGRHWLGKHAVLEEDDNVISVGGGVECSGGNLNATLPTTWYMCVID